MVECWNIGKMGFAIKGRLSDNIIPSCQFPINLGFLQEAVVV
jgi:hypothetical protein